MNTIKIKLSNNVEMPILGLGTYQIRGKDTRQIVEYALETGYRHIDTAQAYYNEEEIGEILKSSSIPRKEIFITTKLDNSNHGYEEAIAAFERSLERLKIDYLDLYLIHWPSNGKRIETWRAFEYLLENNLSRAVGVSNYTVRHLQELFDNSSIKPQVNQIEFNPFVYQKDILDFCKQNDIQVEAYTPLARAKRFNDSDIKRFAGRYEKTPAQILLRWCLQKGSVVIPKSIHKERIKENSQIFDFEISDEDMKILDSKNENLRMSPDPHNIE